MTLERETRPLWQWFGIVLMLWVVFLMSYGLGLLVVPEVRYQDTPEGIPAHRSYP